MLYLTHNLFSNGILCFLTLSIFCIKNNKIVNKILCFRDSICPRPQAKYTVKTYQVSQIGKATRKRPLGKPGIEVSAVLKS